MKPDIRPVTVLTRAILDTSPAWMLLALRSGDARASTDLHLDEDGLHTRFDAGVAERGHVYIKIMIYDSTCTCYPCRADARWPVWDDIIRIARECSTRAIFLENVPGLLTSSGGQSIAKVRADLDNAGYPVQAACVVGAGDVGASHRRDRLFILANTSSMRNPWWNKPSTAWQASVISRSNKLAHTSKPGLEGWPVTSDWHQRQAPQRSGYGIFAPGQGADWSRIDTRFWPATPIEPAICGVADGTAGRVDLTRAQKIRALGNGVVPIQAATALQQQGDER